MLFRLWIMPFILPMECLDIDPWFVAVCLSCRVSSSLSIESLAKKNFVKPKQNGADGFIVDDLEQCWVTQCLGLLNRKKLRRHSPSPYSLPSCDKCFVCQVESLHFNSAWLLLWHVCRKCEPSRPLTLSPPGLLGYPQLSNSVSHLSFYARHTT